MTDKKFPINYDFAKNWDEKVVKHLNNPIILKAIRKGVNDYLSCFPGNKRYKKDTAPASYTSSDGYHMMLDKQKAKIYNRLFPGKDYFRYDEIEDDDDEAFGREMRKRERLLRPYFTWEKIRDKLETYILSHSCFYWAPTFELELARLVEPDEKWIVREGEKHATVINDKGTKVFDILYWQIDGRLDNYIFGTKIKELDETLGGKQAYLDSK